MIFTCLLAFTTIGVHQTDTTTIPVRHQRASKLMAAIKPLEEPGVTLTADDTKGIITVKGKPDQMKATRSYVELFDVARRRLTVKLSVQSEDDKTSYEVSANILNMQEWETSDKEIGLSVSVVPRINADGTITLAVQFLWPNSSLVKSIYRVKQGETVSYSAADPHLKLGQTDSGVQPVTASEPKIKITVVKV